MGVLEWLGAHEFGFLVGLVNRLLSKPKPELKIYELSETGGWSRASRLVTAVCLLTVANERCRAVWNRWTVST
jgi:hypothetical protein